MHFSFDFWNTLARSNPEGTKERDYMLSYLYGVTTEEASERYRTAKTLVDNVSEHSGVQLQHEDVMRIIAGVFGDDQHLKRSEKMLTEMMVSTFDRFPPIIEAKTIGVLRRLVDSGHTISIGSNTNVIRGVDIAPMVEKTGIPFSFMQFSDELGVAKPSFAFFLSVRDRVAAINPAIKYMRDVTHVGDSQKCDILGAQRAGFKTIKITNAATFADEMTIALRETVL